MKSILLLFVCALSAFAQSFDATSLKGTYHFVRLAIVGSETGQPIETQNSGGDIVFDGKGAYKLNAQRGVSSGAAADYQNEGTYTVSTNGVVTITDAANNWNWNVRLSADSAVLIGSSTEAPDGTRDLFIGIRAANWQDWSTGCACSRQLRWRLIPTARRIDRRSDNLICRVQRRWRRRSFGGRCHRTVLESEKSNEPADD
jgi:hypothetical protein